MAVLSLVLRAVIDVKFHVTHRIFNTKRNNCTRALLPYSDVLVDETVL